MLNSVLERLCSPVVSHFPDHIEREFLKNKNKEIFLMLFITIIEILFAALLEEGGMKPDHQAGLFFFTIKLIIFLCTCRTNPKFYKGALSFIITFYRVFSVWMAPDCLFFSLTTVITFPILVYLITESKLMSFLEGAAQLFFLQYFYHYYLTEAIENMPKELFLLRLKHAFTGSITFILLIIIRLDNSFRAAVNKVKVIESERANIERQKILLLSFSHEIRNLINSMTGSIQIALMEAVGNSVIKESLYNAKVCSEMLIHYINNILDSGKDEVGEMEVQPSPCSTHEMFTNMWKVSREFISRKSLSGCLKISKTVPSTINIDSYRINQMLLNLISNAAKFTHVGYISVSVEWIEFKDKVDDGCFLPVPFSEEEGLFEKDDNFTTMNSDFIIYGLNSHISPKFPLVRTLESPGILKISVRDSGVGMKEEDLSKLFKKFSQVSGGTSSKLGAGLGLYITKKLCDKMNGDIRAYSKPGIGSVFMICLPIQALPDQVSPKSNIGVASMNKIMKKLKLKSLIVDDENMNVQVLSTYFDKISVRVLDRASNGKEAFEKYRDLASKGEKPDIVTMDIYMPEYDGKYAARKIRQFERENNLKECQLIIVSGNCTQSEMTECMNKDCDIKADAFLRKPVTIDDLISAIHLNST